MAKKTKGYAKGGAAKKMRGGGMAPKGTKSMANGGAVKAKKMMGGGMMRKRTKSMAKGGAVRRRK